MGLLLNTARFRKMHPKGLHTGTELELFIIAKNQSANLR